MQEQLSFQKTENEMMSLQFNSLMERKILNFWRKHEPQKVEALLSQQILRQTITRKAEDLFDMQLALEKSENLNPVLAKSEAWNRLMRIEENEAEEAAAWGMTLEEYRNRP